MKAASTAETAAAISMPSHRLTPSLSSKALDSRAPMPTNTLWPSDIWPAMPATMFQASARPIYTSASVAMPR